MTAEFGVKSGDRVGEISDYRKIARADAIELRGIDLEVNDLGVRGEARRVAGDTVV